MTNEEITAAIEAENKAHAERMAYFKQQSHTARESARIEIIRLEAQMKAEDAYHENKIKELKGII